MVPNIIERWGWILENRKLCKKWSISVRMSKIKINSLAVFVLQFRKNGKETK
jgi:hypothetical protein